MDRNPGCGQSLRVGIPITMTVVSCCRRWEMAVYVRNVGNREYLTGATAMKVGFPAFTGRPGEPRQWGTQFTLRR